MWEEFISGLERTATINFGMLQLERIDGAPIWRKHDNRSRFDNLSNALFSDKGAHAACIGASDYPKRQYSSTGRLVVPYTSAWIEGEEIAILVRSATPLPESVLIESESIAEFSPSSDSGALQALATLFGSGASSFGLRWLTDAEIVVPTNSR